MTQLTNERFVYATKIVAILVALSACSSDNNTKQFSSFNEYQNLECLWLSNCRQGDFFSCRVDSLELTELWSVESQRGAYQERYACIQHVTSCEEYNSCRSVGALSTPPTCPGDKVFSCDEEKGFWMNCDGGGEQPLPQGQPANLYYDLSLIGASCNGDVLQFPITACTETMCNGRFIEGCFDENDPLFSGFDGYDCASIDPNYSCIIDQGQDFVCGLNTSEGCGEDGEAVRTISCKDDTTVAFCERGETYELSCPAGFACTENALESHCVSTQQ